MEWNEVNSKREGIKGEGRSKGVKCAKSHLLHHGERWKEGKRKETKEEGVKERRKKNRKKEGKKEIVKQAGK